MRGMTFDVAFVSLARSLYTPIYFERTQKLYLANKKSERSSLNVRLW